MDRFDIAYKIFAGHLGFNYVTYPKLPVLQHIKGNKKLNQRIFRSLGFYNQGLKYEKSNFKKEMLIVINQFKSVNELIDYFKKYKKENVLYLIEVAHQSSYQEYLNQGVLKNQSFTGKASFRTNYQHSLFNKGIKSKEAKLVKERFIENCSEEERETNTLVHIRRDDTGILSLGSMKEHLKPEFKKYNYFDIFNAEPFNIMSNSGKRKQMNRPYQSTKEIFEAYLKVVKEKGLDRKRTMVLSDLYEIVPYRRIEYIFAGGAAEQRRLTLELIDDNNKRERKDIYSYFSSEVLALGNTPKTMMFLIYKYLESDFVFNNEATKFEMIYDFIPNKESTLYKI